MDALENDTDAKHQILAEIGRTYNSEYEDVNNRLNRLKDPSYKQDRRDGKVKSVLDNKDEYLHEIDRAYNNDN